MRSFRINLLAALCGFILTSCQTFHTTEADGTATLNANSFRLPPRIGFLQRTYITAFDGSGHNVGAGYNYYSQQQKTALTVYVLSARDGTGPTGSDLEQHFVMSHQEVLNAHANSAEVRTIRIDGHDSWGRLSEFRYDKVFARSLQRVASFLAVFSDGNRLVKYRITGPEAEREKVYNSLLQAIGKLSEIN